MKILITGASSFVGRVLGKNLSSIGHELVGAVRDEAIKDIEGYNKIVQWSIGDSTYSELLDGGVEGVIHLAFDETLSGEVNIDSVVTLACNAKVKKIKQIYITPAIANGNTGIPLLEAKYQAEEKLKKFMTVVKCGIVQGNGGPYIDLCRYMVHAKLFSHYIPNDVYLPLISQRYLGQIVDHHIQSDGAGVHFYFDSRPSLKALLSRFSQMRKAPLFRFPLPRAWNLKFNSLIERVNGKTPLILKMLILGTAPTENYCQSFVTHHIEDVVV